MLADLIDRVSVGWVHLDECHPMPQRRLGVRQRALCINAGEFFVGSPERRHQFRLFGKQWPNRLAHPLEQGDERSRVTRFSVLLGDAIDRGDIARITLDPCHGEPRPLRLIAEALPNHRSLVEPMRREKRVRRSSRHLLQKCSVMSGVLLAGQMSFGERLSIMRIPNQSPNQRFELRRIH